MRAKKFDPKTNYQNSAARIAIVVVLAALFVCVLS